MAKYVPKENIVVQKEIKADLPEFDIIDDSRPLVGPAYSGEQYESRFPRIYEMMLYEKLGYNEMRDLGAKEFGITGRMMEYQMKEAKMRLKMRYEDKSEEIIEQQLARMFDLLHRCRRDGNKKVERELLSDLNKIYGLENRKLDITSNGEPISININID
jgi:hypothetical protein